MWERIGVRSWTVLCLVAAQAGVGHFVAQKLCGDARVEGSRYRLCGTQMCGLAHCIALRLSIMHAFFYRRAGRRLTMTS